LIAVSLWLMLTVGCANAPMPSDERPILDEPSSGGTLGMRVARVAVSQAGAPYRFGGALPDGFDCSGLVVYSFARAGRPGLPHSVTQLDKLSRGVPIDALQPGDLLFFRLRWGKKSHVGIYLGDRRFVHAPSSGKSVEVVSFDHVYWGPRIKLAGRLE